VLPTLEITTGIKVHYEDNVEDKEMMLISEQTLLRWAWRN